MFRLPFLTFFTQLNNKFKLPTFKTQRIFFVPRSQCFHSIMPYYKAALASVNTGGLAYYVVQLIQLICQRKRTYQYNFCLYQLVSFLLGNAPCIPVNMGVYYQGCFEKHCQLLTESFLINFRSIQSFIHAHKYAPLKSYSPSKLCYMTFLLIITCQPLVKTI